MELLCVFGVAVLGGILPLLGRGNDRILHGCLAFSTGIFLAAVFLHLLPEMVEVSASQEAAQEASVGVDGDEDGEAHDHEDGEAHDHEDGEAHDHEGGHGHGHSHSSEATLLWLFVLIGVLGVYLAETLLFGSEAMDDVVHHRNVSYAALLGLSLHAFTAGIAYAAASEAVAAAMFVAIMAHKGFETFSLCSVFRLAEFSKGRILLMILLFSAVTPLGMALGSGVVETLGERERGIAIALSAGTFLYVCLCELLPEVFHRREDGLLKVVLLAAGIALMATVQGFTH